MEQKAVIELSELVEPRKGALLAHSMRICICTTQLLSDGSGTPRPARGAGIDDWLGALPESAISPRPHVLLRVRLAEFRLELHPPAKIVYCKDENAKGGIQRRVRLPR